MGKFTFLLLVFFMISVNIITSRILTGNELKNCSQEHQKMIQILKRCFQKVFSTIIAKLESNACVINFFEELSDTSIILINNNHKVQNQTCLFSGVPIYVLEVNSAKDLENTLTILGSLQWWPWWNREVMFFLIGSSNNSCNDAHEILNTMWTEKLLSTIYVCHDHKNNIHKIFTYNPFTNRAPKPWKLSKNNSSGRWTLYEQHYQENEEICLNLMFDKTKYLDGYEIKTIYETDRNISINNSSVYAWLPKMKKLMGFFILDVTKILNISMFVTKYNITRASHCHGKVNLELVTSKYDICLNEIPLGHLYPHITHPFFRIKLGIFTEKSRFLRPEEKILSYYTRNRLLIFIFVAIILLSAGVLQKNKHQKFSVAVLKIWQSVFSFVIRDAMTKLWVRIYFFGVLLLFVIVSEAFKGNLAAFLTKPDRIFVDNIQDLMNLGYRIYVPTFFKCSLPSSITENIPANKLFDTKEHRCMHYVDNRTACINSYFEFVFLNSSQDRKYHLSNQMAWANHLVWLTSAKFSLKKRLNTFILRYIQSGIIEQWFNLYFLEKVRQWHYFDHDEVKTEFRPIELNDLVFAFKFLIIGLSCSFVCFIMEIRHR